MWFQFPQGTTGISINLQEFNPEVTEEVEVDGKKIKVSFFRAPDHFAGQILDLPGFKLGRPTQTDLPDLPQADPLRDSAIGKLTAETESLKAEIETYKAIISELKAQRDDVVLKVLNLEGEVSQLKEELAQAKSTSKDVVKEPLKK